MIFDSFVKGKHRNVFLEKMAFLKFLLFTLKLHMEKMVWSTLFQPGLHKTGNRGIQDTRQIVDGKTNYINKLGLSCAKLSQVRGYG